MGTTSDGLEKTPLARWGRGGCGREKGSRRGPAVTGLLRVLTAEAGA